MKANKDNPAYDMEGAQTKLNQMAADYQNAVEEQKRKPEVLTETQRMGNAGTISKYDTPEGREAIDQEIEKYEALLSDVKKAREVALKSGDETTKYDNYIKEYNNKLSELRSATK